MRQVMAFFLPNSLTSGVRKADKISRKSSSNTGTGRNHSRFQAQIRSLPNRLTIKTSLAGIPRLADEADRHNRTQLAPENPHLGDDLPKNCAKRAAKSRKVSPSVTFFSRALSPGASGRSDPDVKAAFFKIPKTLTFVISAEVRAAQ